MADIQDRVVEDRVVPDADPQLSERPGTADEHVDRGIGVLLGDARRRLRLVPAPAR